MKRVIHSLHIIAIPLSFLLFLASSILWFRSTKVLDDHSYHLSSPTHRTYTSLGLRTQPGYLLFSWSHGRWDLRADFLRDDPLSEENLAANPFHPRPGFNHRTTSSRASGWSFWDRQRLRIDMGTLSTPHHMGGFGSISYGDVSFPPWFFPAISSLLPLLYFRRRLIRARRQRRGLCPTCGYDLRTASEICPECGTARQPTSNPAVSS